MIRSNLRGLSRKRIRGNCAFIFNHKFTKRVSTLQPSLLLIALGIAAQAFYLSETVANLLVTMFILYLYHNQNGRLVKALDVRSLAAIGIISYGLYVWQGVFTGNGPYREGAIFPPHNIDIGFLLTVIVAPISYWYFERRLLALKERFRARKKTSNAPNSLFQK